MIDLEKLKSDLREAARAAELGHLTRAELLQLRIEVAWTQVAVREGLIRAKQPKRAAIRARQFHWSSNSYDPNCLNACCTGVEFRGPAHDEPI